MAGVARDGLPGRRQARVNWSRRGTVLQLRVLPQRYGCAKVAIDSLQRPFALPLIAHAISALLAAFFALGAVAGPLPPQARGEINALLRSLESSGCEFHRNGEWHPGAKATSHLATKLKYLEDHGLVASAEQFIERAASSSSTSGKPYLVRCGGGAAVTSAAWLTEQLKAVRASSAGR